MAVVYFHNQFAGHVKRNDLKLGPFTYFEIIRQLQEKVIHSADLICSQESQAWIKICECEHFKPENIRSLLESSAPEVQNVFFKRLPRIRFYCEVTAHLSKEYFEGQSVELSANGAGLILDDQKIDVGQNLFLFFKVSDEIPRFNAIGSVVSKLPYKQEIKYGIKFLNINRDIRDIIKNFTHNKAQKKAA